MARKPVANSSKELEEIIKIKISIKLKSGSITLGFTIHKFLN